MAFSAGSAELLADADRPGGWLLLLDRIRQSYVDLDDPTYLDFEYVQAFADVLDALPDGPLAVTHVGGGACTLARYIAATRPGSPQIVLEPDAELIALVRSRLPFARDARVRIRPIGGRDGVAALRDGSADVVVLDAFLGGRVPSELTTAEFAADVARVLRRHGVLLVNVADGPPGVFARRFVAALSESFADVAVLGDPSVVKQRRFGNLVLVASRTPLPLTELSASAARAMFPRTVLAGTALTRWRAGALPLTDTDSMRSPSPPDEVWRVVN
ncbi:MAG TPA: fused MFS/spermidine synthase [Jatrophihabitantaceae bacterium]|nr:fused MFS/spermidine synthase [Jatrophihabitantaceae bacterium]